MKMEREHTSANVLSNSSEPSFGVKLELGILRQDAEWVRKELDNRKQVEREVATNEEFVPFLDSASDKALDEATILRRELAVRTDEVALILSKYETLQEDYQCLQRLHEELVKKYENSDLIPNGLSNGEMHKLRSDQLCAVQRRVQVLESENEKLKESVSELVEKRKELMTELKIHKGETNGGRTSLLLPETEFSSCKTKKKSPNQKGGRLCQLDPNIREQQSEHKDKRIGRSSAAPFELSEEIGEKKRRGRPRKALSHNSTFLYDSLLPCQVELTRLSDENIDNTLTKIKTEKGNADACYPPNTKKESGEEDVDPDYVSNSIPCKRNRRFEHTEAQNTSMVTKRAYKRRDCAECGRNFKSPVLLSAHLRIYHRPSYDCFYCMERYSDRKELKAHLNIEHEAQKKERCEECKKGFFSKFELKKHRQVHSDKKTVICSICNGQFPSETSLKAHQLTHASDESKLPGFICPVTDCKRKYTQLQFLQSHVRYMHERRNQFRCPYAGCKKSFGTESYLNAHIISHESTGTHLCELCGKNYKHKKDLRIHERRVHSEEKLEELKSFACEVCPKRYFRADHLRIHRVKSKHWIGGEEPQLPSPTIYPLSCAADIICPTCNKVFVTDMALKTHQFTHEGGGDDEEEDHLYPCTECKKKYKTTKALDYHVKYMHRLKGSFACSYCSKSFGRLSSFKRHLTVHSNTQHICGDCNKSYKNKTDLVHHYKREHIIGKEGYEHECGICMKRFYRKDMLRMHLVKTGHSPAPSKKKKKKGEEGYEEVAIYVVDASVREEEEEATPAVLVDGGTLSTTHVLVVNESEEIETEVVSGEGLPNYYSIQIE